jgi:hypothetical protein
MMTVSTSEESERRLAEAMRAHATGVGRPGFVGRHPGWTADPIAPPAAPAPRSHPDGWSPAAPVAGRSGLRAALLSTRIPLLWALLGGIVVGIALALLSLLVPGFLPPLG